MNETNDLTQIGISSRMHPHLKALMEDGYFAEMRDAYRFAIALAIAKGLKTPTNLSNRVNIFATPTVDPDGTLAAAIRTLMPCEEITPYRWAELLAESGVELLASKSSMGNLDIVEIINDAGGTASDVSAEAY